MSHYAAVDFIGRAHSVSWAVFLWFGFYLFGHYPTICWTDGWSIRWRIADGDEDAEIDSSGTRKWKLVPISNTPPPISGCWMNEFRATISTDNEIESIERERERERERVIWAPLIRSRSFHHFQIQDPIPSISSPMRHDRKQYRETNINSSFIFRRQFHGRDHTTDSIFFFIFCVSFFFCFVVLGCSFPSPTRGGSSREDLW